MFTRERMMEAARELQNTLDPTPALDESFDDLHLAIWTRTAAGLLDSWEVSEGVRAGEDLVPFSERAKEVIVFFRDKKGETMIKSLETKVSAEKKEQKMSKKAKKKVDKIEKRASEINKAKKQTKSKSKGKTDKTKVASAKTKRGFRVGTASALLEELFEKGTTGTEVYNRLSKAFPNRGYTPGSQGSAHHAMRTFASQLRKKGYNYVCKSGIYKITK